MQYRFSSRGKDDLLSLEPHSRRRVFEKLEFFFSQKNPIVFAKKLSNFPYGTYRFRIGKVRVIFVVEDDIATITRIRFRSEAYR